MCLRQNVKSGQAGSDSSLKHLSHLPQFAVQKITEIEVMFSCLVALDYFCILVSHEPKGHEPKAVEDKDCW